MYSFMIWTLDSYFSRLEAEMLARVMIFGAKLIRIDGQLFQYQTEVTQRAQRRLTGLQVSCLEVESFGQAVPPVPLQGTFR